MPCSGKFSHDANFRIFRVRALHAKIKKNYGNLNDRKLCVNFDLATGGEDRIQTELCQILKRPTQRLLISSTIETEAKKAPKPGARAPCCAVGHR